MLQTEGIAYRNFPLLPWRCAARQSCMFDGWATLSHVPRLKDRVNTSQEIPRTFPLVPTRNER